MGNLTWKPQIAGLIGLLVLGSAALSAQAGSAPAEGSLAPPFAIATDQGNRITPTNFGGKLLVLNFWHTSCVPCVKELPSLTEFAHAFRSRGVVVVAVRGDEDAAKYKRFLQDHEVELETYRDPSLRISKSYGTLMFPETYVIQDGKIVRKVVGGIDWMSRDIASLVQTRLKNR